VSFHKFKAPPTIRYIPNFISAEKEQELMKKIGDFDKSIWEFKDGHESHAWFGKTSDDCIFDNEDFPDVSSKRVIF
jgi:hypothetical protein